MSFFLTLPRPSTRFHTNICCTKSIITGSVVLPWVELKASSLAENKPLQRGTISMEADIDSGVPQGTVVGLLLFLAFINNFPEAIHSQVICWWLHHISHHQLDLWHWSTPTRSQCIRNMGEKTGRCHPSGKVHYNPCHYQEEVIHS